MKKKNEILTIRCDRNHSDTTGVAANGHAENLWHDHSGHGSVRRVANCIGEFRERFQTRSSFEQLFRRLVQVKAEKRSVRKQYHARSRGVYRHLWIHFDPLALGLKLLRIVCRIVLRIFIFIPVFAKSQMSKNERTLRTGSNGCKINDLAR